VAVTFCLETEDTWRNTADLPQVMDKYLSLDVVLIVCYFITNNSICSVFSMFNKLRLDGSVRFVDTGGLGKVDDTKV
jgi:hypothetical protein